MTAAGRLFRFHAGGARLSLPAAQVREVVERTRTTTVPHAPPGLLGLANVRGAVLPVIAGSALAGTGDADSARRFVVVEARHRLAIAVDTIDGLTHDADDAAAVDIDEFIARHFGGSGVAPARRSGAAHEAPEQRADEAALLMFAIGDQSFALPLKDVERVMRLPDAVARVPHADAAVVGSVAFEDALLPLLSLAALLALPADAERGKARVVVVRIGAHRVGLTVDAVQAVISVSEDRIDSLPAALARGQAEARIQAICRLGDGRQLVSVLAAEHLVREELTARLLQGGAEQAAENREEKADRETFLVFRLGTRDFALAVGAVDEVVAFPAKVTPLPRAPGFVTGVIERRGDAVPLIDQTMRFDGRPAAGQRRVIIVTVDGLTAGFVVDSASEILAVPEGSLSPAPELPGDAGQFERVINHDGRLILVIGARQLLDRAEHDLLAALVAKASNRLS